ncbi:hypothetical protein ACVNIS_04435 [Sphaerotilaceae bacterium SBD11-9]
MNHDTPAQTPAARVINALLRVLAPGEEVCVETELLKHFPFARLGEQPSRHAALRIPTTAHGAL